MKKALITIVFFLFVAIIVSSCAAHQKCPAYSQANKYKSERIKY